MTGGEAFAQRLMRKQWWRYLGGLLIYGALFNFVNARGQEVPEPVLVELQHNAQQGNLDAQYQLAMKYLNGDGVPSDLPMALKWLRKSVDGGHLRAEYQLGIMYRDGVGVPKDLELAMRWLRVAAGSGHTQAQTAYDALNRAQLTREFDKLQASAQAGDAAAQYALGRNYLTGKAPQAVNPAQALAWLTRAAEQQQADAQYEVGVIYKDGSSVPRDLERAKLWLGKAAAQGHVKAKVALQDIIRDTGGTSASVEKAFKSSETLPVYRAAMNGDVNSQFELGLMYIHGEAVPKDFTRGVEWLQRAGEQDHAGAQLQLADMYLLGVEIQQDAAAAFQWYQRAARHGNPQAQYMLGNLYRAGSGVRENFTEARRWYAAAAKQGHAKAKERLAAEER
ncbi:MAG: sel1 repeat family protein [Gammaproteobacteria bacterium]|nr:sel1 repeat family protein [Gammaproteobacteria bacterium]